MGIITETKLRVIIYKETERGAGIREGPDLN